MTRSTRTRTYLVPLNVTHYAQRATGLCWLSPLLVICTCTGANSKAISESGVVVVRGDAAGGLGDNAGTDRSNVSISDAPGVVNADDVSPTQDGGGGGNNASADGETGSSATATTPGLKVAFISDQGTGSDSEAVLKLIESEGADLVLHQGDLDYEAGSNIWESMITKTLGADFPYFVSVGNHDGAEWSGYQSMLTARLQKVPEANCEGDLGVKSACTFRGLFFILSGVGERGSGHESYIREQLTRSKHEWRICSWHKNQSDMQAGGKGDSVGWTAYQACQNGGAIVATGHEHSYSRTMNLRDLGNRGAGHGASPPLDQLTVKPGQTFVFVSGLGGKSKRDYHSEHDTDTWWATIYTSNLYVENGTTVSGYSYDFGALFITFNVGGDSRKAEGYFKTINGQVIDEFSVRSAN